AFDTPAQYAETAALARDYNAHGYEITPAIDAHFAQLAGERIAAHPLRFYLWLPLGRVADMWLRPRVENLPIDLDWWIYAHHHAETRFSWFYAALLGGNARLHAAAQRFADDRRSARGALHARVLSDVVCARRSCDQCRDRATPTKPPRLIGCNKSRRRNLELRLPALFRARHRFTYVVLLSVLKLKASFGSD